MLAHTRAGDGSRPLVLLHGFLGSSRNLAALARRLVAGDASLSVFAFDLRGHGGSPPLPQDANLGTLASDVLSTAASLGLGRPITLVGHSLGGRVGLRIALDDPVALEHLVLLDISPSPASDALGDVAHVLDALAHAPATAAGREPFRRALLSGGLSADVVEWLLLNLEREGETYRWRIDRHALTALHRRVSAEDLWPAVERPRSHGLHGIRGGRSPYVSDRDAARLKAAGCRLDTIPDAGHWLPTERPAEVGALVLAGRRRD